jgi:adenylate cyclase
MVHEILDNAAQLAESVGDEVLIVANDAKKTIDIALKLRDKVEKEPNFPSVHIGIHAGSVLEQDGQYFGSAINIASRVAAHARADQILCTDVVIDLLSNRNIVKHRPLGKVNFKNIVEPIAVFEVGYDYHRADKHFTDPVCRMRVKPDSASARLNYMDQNYFFCSFECVKAFANRPKQYIEK